MYGYTQREKGVRRRIGIIYSEVVDRILRKRLGALHCQREDNKKTLKEWYRVLCGAGGSNCVDPLASVLKIENNHNVSHGSFAFS